MELVGLEAELRERDQVLDMNSYINFRRETSAVRTCFDLVEYCLGLDLPQYVHEDAVFISGYNAAMDLVFLANVRRCVNLSWVCLMDKPRIYFRTTWNKHYIVLLSRKFIIEVYEAIMMLNRRLTLPIFASIRLFTVSRKLIQQAIVIHLCSFYPPR